MTVGPTTKAVGVAVSVDTVGVTASACRARCVRDELRRVVKHCI
jgi:hypothetical protein